MFSGTEAEFTSYGVFGLMAEIVGLYGMDVLLPYIKIATMKEAILSVFATCSSVATISLNLKYTKNLGAVKRLCILLFLLGQI